VGNNIQAIFGPRSENIKGQIEDIIAGKTPMKVEEVKTAVVNNKAAKETYILPMKGKLVSLSEVPDQIFSQKMMGDGFAVYPTGGEVLAPVSGKIVNVFPTKHAIGIESDGGREIIIHVGIDTVKLKGKGFDVFVKAGDKVTQGQLLMKVDLDFIEKNAVSVVTPVVFTNLADGEKVDIEEGEEQLIKIVNK